MDFARCKKLRTKTDFDLVIVEGSKLGMESYYNCSKKSRKKFEYIVREYYYFGCKTNAGTYFNFKSDFDTDKGEKQKQISAAKHNKYQPIRTQDISYVQPLKSVFVFDFCLCVEIRLEIKICSCFCLIAKIILFSNNIFNFFS